MTTNRIAGLALGLSCLSALALPAHAYVIQETSTGREIRFRTLPHDFFLAEGGAADISGGAEFVALASAFQSWDDVPDSDARFSNLAAVNMDKSDIYTDGGLPGRDRKNLIAWVEEDWFEGGALIALTYTYFIETSGKILEDDITMNGVDYTWTTDDGTVMTDVESIAAHEIGHAYGIGHSLEADATMFATASQGETQKRSLSPDDMAAIQHSYPPGCCPKTKSQEALAFFGCSVGDGQGSQRSGGAAVLAALVAGVCLTTVMRRRRLRGAALAAALLTLPLAAATANASVARALALEEMARGSDSVVRGRVIWTHAMTLPGGAIVTLTEIEVEDVLAGDAPATVTVVEPGGEPGDTGVGMLVSGTARFEMGEEVVVFAEAARSAYARHFPGTFRPLAMSQGKMRVIREEGAPARLVRDLSGVARMKLDAAEGWVPAGNDELDGITLDELVYRISRARVSP